MINPIGTMAIQIRVSEMLAVIPFFNRKYIPGIILGVGIANLFSGLGVMDVVVGVGIAVIAYTISYFIKNVWINAAQYSLLCGIFVGLMLWMVARVPASAADEPGSVRPRSTRPGSRLMRWAG